jgi:histone deacetylase 6
MTRDDSKMDVDVQPGTSAAAMAASSSIDHPRASSVPLHPSHYTVGYVFSSEMTSHFSPHGHPEDPERIKRIHSALISARHTEKMKRLPIRPVRKEEALLVHSEDHWDKVAAIQSKFRIRKFVCESTSEFSGNPLEMTEQERIDSEEYYEQLSLYVMPGTTRAALLSCGGVIEACLSVARDELKKTFAIVRPPGHHAEPDEHMGFCFFNNVAVAARVVQQLTPVKKILILDWYVIYNS